MGSHHSRHLCQLLLSLPSGFWFRPVIISTDFVQGSFGNLVNTARSLSTRVGKSESFQTAGGTLVPTAPRLAIDPTAEGATIHVGFF